MPSSLFRLIATAMGVVALIPATAQAADVTTVGVQQQLTEIGPNGNLAFQAHEPTIAYNSRDDEFLLAWLGRDPLAPGETEVYGRILDGAGKPKDSVVRRLSTVSGTPEQPVVSYSSAVNTYILAYVAPPPAGPNNPAGQEEIIGQIVTATGAPSGEPARISDTDPGNVDADQASDPAVAYDPAHDQFRFVWRADATVEGDFEIQTRRVSSTLIDADGIPAFQVSNMAAGDADEPDIVYLPAQERYVTAWQGDVAAGDTEVFVDVMRFDSLNVASDVQVSVATGTNDSTRPALAANTRGNEALVAFIKNDVTGEGAEMFVQRVSSAGGQIPNTVDTRISTMGPANNLAFGVQVARTTTATYHPLLDQYFVTWAADNDFPGLVDQEFERYGQALDASGSEVGGDDIRLSANGVDGNATATVENGATAVNPTKRAWLHVWSADDNRPPLADNEFEIFGRLAGDDGDLDGAVVPADCNDADASIRPGATDVIDNGIDEDCSGADTENLDRDADGSARPADCNDANGAVRPGAADLFDNGVDEDCAGGDAVNLDRDGDGSLRPVDCNDGNGAIRPGARDIPRNRVDEDCSGKDAAFPNLGANVSNSWDVDGTRFKLLTLAVTQQFPKGMKASIRCNGAGCPFRTKSLKLGKVRRNARNAITSLSPKQRRFRAGQTIEVLVSAPGFNTKVARMPLKFDKVPRTQSLCALPGSTKAQKSCG